MRTISFTMTLVLCTAAIATAQATSCSSLSKDQQAFNICVEAKATLQRALATVSKADATSVQAGATSRLAATAPSRVAAISAAANEAGAASIEASNSASLARSAAHEADAAIKETATTHSPNLTDARNAEGEAAADEEYAASAEKDAATKEELSAYTVAAVPAAILSSYAQLYNEFFHLCGLKSKLHFLHLGSQRIQLPGKVCAFVLGDYGLQKAQCTVDAFPHQNIVGDSSNVGLGAVFGAVRAVDDSKPAPLPGTTGFAIDGLIDLSRSFMLDREDCNEVVASQLSASAASIASGKIATNNANDLQLTFASGHFWSPLYQLAQSDPNRFEWEVLDWYRLKNLSEEGGPYQFVKMVHADVAELELHSRAATDVTGAVQASFGMAVFGASAQGYVQNHQADVAHFHRYVLLDHGYEPVFTALPTRQNVVDILKSSLQLTAGLAFNSKSKRLEKTLFAPGMPIDLCAKGGWVVGRQPAKNQMQTLLPNAWVTSIYQTSLSEPASLAGCQLTISMPLSDVGLISQPKSDWVFGVSRPYALPLPLMTAIDSAEVDPFRVGLGNPSNSRYPLTGAGVSNIDASKPLDASRLQAGKCRVAATLVPEDVNDLSAGYAVNINVANTCGAVKGSVGVPMQVGEYLYIELPQHQE